MPADSPLKVWCSRVSEKLRQEIGEKSKGVGLLRPQEVIVTQWAILALQSQTALLGSHLHPCPALDVQTDTHTHLISRITFPGCCIM